AQADVRWAQCALAERSLLRSTALPVRRPVFADCLREKSESGSRRQKLSASPAQPSPPGFEKPHRRQRLARSECILSFAWARPGCSDWMTARWPQRPAPAAPNGRFLRHSIEAWFRPARWLRGSRRTVVSLRPDPAASSSPAPHVRRRSPKGTVLPRRPRFGSLFRFVAIFLNARLGLILRNGIRIRRWMWRLRNRVGVCCTNYRRFPFGFDEWYFALTTVTAAIASLAKVICAGVLRAASTNSRGLFLANTADKRHDLHLFPS